MRVRKSRRSMYAPMTERQKQLLNGVELWASYYRSNINRFVYDFLHVDLHLFQAVLLVMMNIATTFVLIACRGIGKSFIAAIFCVVRCILYPGTKIVIASGTRGQAVNVLEKIMTELVPNSPELQYEIDMQNTTVNISSPKIMFKNGSFIKVVTSNESSRSNRANILIIDEFRLVKKSIIEDVLRRFLANPRHPKYLDLPEYKGKKEFLEPNKTVYLSSAGYKDHWSFTTCNDVYKNMIGGRKSFICGFPYQLALQEGIIMEDGVIEQMSETDFNEISWSMEMESLFYGDLDGAFFNFTAISKNRNIEYAMLPSDIVSKIPGAQSKFGIQPKALHEVRILSADIALMASRKHKNDATAIFINQLLPTKAGKFVSNIVYTESNEGKRTEEEALRIRKLFDEFDCDYIVLDVKNIGISIFDALAADMVDPETGDIYPALTCCNNDDVAARCAVTDAQPVIWAINGSQKLNSECALMLREGFRSGRIRLLINEYDAELKMNECIKGFSKLNPAEKFNLELPYINTTLLIGELINLNAEQRDGLIKVSEKSGERKDRYSSLSYNYYVALQLERKINKENPLSSGAFDDFIFRAPKKFRSYDERR